LEQSWRVHFRVMATMSSSSAGSRRFALASRAPWDGTTLDAWQGEIDGSGVVINLAGRTVNCRYNAANRH
jgi:hypothetical protein